MDYRIVPMAPEHIDQVSILEHLCFTSPWSKETLAAQLDRRGVHYLVAEAVATGQVLGCAGLQIVLDEGNIDDVAVHPDFRGLGIARALMDVFVRYAEKELAFLTLEVRQSNAAAIGLYESFGFLREGLRKNYYTNPKEHAIIMTRRFDFETI